MRKGKYFFIIYIKYIILNIEDDPSFDQLPISDNVSSMSSIRFDRVDIANRLKKLNVSEAKGPDGIHYSPKNYF